MLLAEKAGLFPLKLPVLVFLCTIIKQDRESAKHNQHVKLLLNFIFILFYTSIIVWDNLQSMH
jgi:hypothetical protein